MNTDRIFIISGPSGSGQDSVIERLAEIMPIERVITSTTRPPRPGETSGAPYYFLSRDQFESGIERGDFIEWAREYNDELYGVTKEELLRVAKSQSLGIWKMEYKGVITAKSLFPNIVAILITAPLESIEARLRKRDDPTEAYLAERMTYTREWLNYTHIYDYTVENLDGKLEESVKKITEIIKERIRP